MTEDHDRIEELLAGYALEALSGADAEAAEELLTEHVPTCVTCRRLLQDYRRIAGDLALAAPAESAPDTLLASLRRDIAETDGLAGRHRRLPAWLGAAAAVAFVAMGGLSAFLLQRMGTVQDERQAAEAAIEFFADPASRVVPMEREQAGTAEAAVAWKPGGTRCVLYVERIPRPRREHPYEVWLVRDGVPEELAATFRYRDRATVVVMSIDLARYDGIWIVEARERGGDPPTVPVMTADW